MYSVTCLIGKLGAMMKELEQKGFEITGIEDVYVFDGPWLSRIDKEIIYK